jgi:hypothetical protein
MTTLQPTKRSVGPAARYSQPSRSRRSCRSRETRQHCSCFLALLRAYLPLGRVQHSMSRPKGRHVFTTHVGVRPVRKALSPSPHWVRAATARYGDQRSPTDTTGPEKAEVNLPTTQPAAMVLASESDCGPDGQGRHRRAADGQQPVSVGTGEAARKPWRIMTCRFCCRRPVTWGFSWVFPVLNTA